MKPHVALIAPFSSFSDSYSLAQVVRDQCRALSMRGMRVAVWTLRSCDLSGPIGAAIAPHVVPCLPWPDSGLPDRHRSREIGDALHEVYRTQRPRWIIAHDCCFQNGYRDFGRAIHENAHRMRRATWLHWTHSAVRTDAPAVTSENVWSRRLPDGHFLVYPNSVDALKVRAYFGINPERLLTCPNPRDPRAFWRLSAEADRICTSLDLLRRDIVQVYPFCMTRWFDKGVDRAATLFGALKRAGKRVCLILAAANARDRVADMAKIREAAPDLGPDELVFAADLGFPDVVPNGLVSELMRLSNLFVFPTAAEACPLVMIEAAMSGCLLVLNSNVPALREYAPPGSIMLPFDALGVRVGNRVERRTVRPNPADGRRTITRVSVLNRAEAEREVMDGYAKAIIDAMERSPAHQARRVALRVFSPEAVGERLEWVMEEAERRRSANGWQRLILNPETETSNAVT